MSNHNKAVWNGCPVHAVFCDGITVFFFQQIAVNGHFGHGMPDDEEVCWPQAIVLLQAMIEELEAEDIDNGEE